MDIAVMSDHHNLNSRSLAEHDDVDPANGDMEKAQLQEPFPAGPRETMTTRTGHPYVISPVPGKGLGIRAAKDIPDGEEVMACAAREIPPFDGEIPFPVAQYLFVDPEAYLESDEGTRRYRMVCGDMVFLNHSDRPNCGVSWFRNPNGVLFSRLSAERCIHAGEELTIRYSDAYDYLANGYF